MSKLPTDASYRKVMKLLIEIGYTPKPKESRGSHVLFEKDGCRSIPVSTSKIIPQGTLRGILKQADINRKQFWDIWNKL